jgi:hypothetical protein
MQALTQVRFKFDNLGQIEQRLGADAIHPQQGVAPTLLVTLEVVASRIGINQQRAGHIGGGPDLPEKDDRIDPVRLASAGSALMGDAQLREVVFAELVVEHAS